MSKDYLKYDIEKTKMTEDDFEILKNYYEEDEIDNIEYQMNIQGLINMCVMILHFIYYFIPLTKIQITWHTLPLMQLSMAF